MIGANERLGFLPDADGFAQYAKTRFGTLCHHYALCDNLSHSRKGIPSAHMHWASISDLATLGMYAWPVQKDSSNSELSYITNRVSR